MMRNQQRGMTTIGMIIVVAILGLLVFAIIQMGPVYLENMRIVSVLNKTKTEFDGQNASLTNIRKSLAKRANIESLYDVDAKKDFIIKRVEGGYEVSANYERRRPYVANLYLLAVFEHSVVILR